MKETAKLGSLMMMFCFVAAAALSITYILAAPRIADELSRRTRAALREALPLAEDFVASEEAGTAFYKGTRGGSAVGLVVQVIQKGYSGPIEMLVGIDPNGRVTGVKILRQTETPGLGSNTANEKFLSQFNGKTSEDKLKAKYDIQAVTGATISSQAVSDGVRAALKFLSISGRKF